MPIKYLFYNFSRFVKFNSQHVTSSNWTTVLLVLILQVAMKISYVHNHPDLIQFVDFLPPKGTTQENSKLNVIISDRVGQFNFSLNLVSFTFIDQQRLAYSGPASSYAILGIFKIIKPPQNIRHAFKVELQASMFEPILHIFL